MASVRQVFINDKVRFIGEEPYQVSFLYPPQAGSTIVVFACGGAIPTIKFNDNSGVQFDQRTPYGGGAMYAGIHDAVASGGETHLFVDLNGEENISLIVYELVGVGAFAGASNNGSGTTPSQSNNLRVGPTSSVTATTKSVLVSGYAAVAPLSSRQFNEQNQWRQLGPVGKMNAGFNQPGAHTEYIWSVGLSDVDQNSSYPYNLSDGEYQARSVWIFGDSCFAAQALYENPGDDINDPEDMLIGVAKENSLPGDHMGNWFAPDTKSGSINGYTDKVSYLPGETVNFKVDSTNNPFQVELYRLGYYGWETLSAKSVTDAPILGTQMAQPAPSVNSTYGSTSCNWTTNATWTVPSDIQSGVFYAIFRRTDDTSQFSSTLFVVKDSDVAGKIVVVLPFCTYQAYNVWGSTADAGNIPNWSGRSLYQIGSETIPNSADRAYAVSFDRPYSTNTTQSNTWFFDAEFGIVQYLESQGFDTVSYIADIDLELDPTALDGASVVMPIGHHEYWTDNQYDAFESAGNTLWVSSNTGLWRTRFAPEDANKRLMICYKDSATLDVGPGFTGDGRDPVSWTGTWRDARYENARREDALTGQLFWVSAPASGTFNIDFEYKDLPIWRNSPDVQALTEGQSYDTVVNNMGDELDYVDEASPTKQTNLVKLCPTVASYTNGANAAGSQYTTPTGSIEFSFTLHKVGDKVVFNTGSWRGFNGISRFKQGTYDSGAVIDVNMQNALNAIIMDLGLVFPQTPRGMRQGTDSPSQWSYVPNVFELYGLSVQADDNSQMMMFFI